MQYQDYDYATESDTAPWSAAPNTASAPLVSAPAQRSLPAQPAASSADVMALGNLIQSVQQTQVRQLYMMRDMDVRIARIEAPLPAQPVYVQPTYERATWWALWGLLMLILGGALSIVIMLILLNIEFR